MDLYCKNCNHKLTLNPLKLTLEEELNSNSGQDLLKSGMYIPSLENEYGPDLFDYLIATDSIILSDHKDKSRFIGCCGPSNFETFNQICPKCDSEIGVIIADCYTSHFTGIDSKKVFMKPL